MFYAELRNYVNVGAVGLRYVSFFVGLELVNSAVCVLNSLPKGIALLLSSFGGKSRFVSDLFQIVAQY